MSALKSSTNKRLAPPSPSPSNASNTSAGGTPSKRQKREGAMSAAAAALSAKDRASPTPTPAAMAAATTSYGTDMLTQLSYAVEFLKSKGTPKALQEVLDHLSLQHTPEAQQRQFAALMGKHPRMSYIPGPRGDKKIPGWKLGRYEFRAKIPGVNSKVTLLAHLQAKTDASSLAVKDLKDGWPDCDKAIEELETEHKILVVRTRKDNHAKFVWLDNPQLAHSVDPEFRVMWHRVDVPTVDDIVRKLTAVGQKPASEDPRLKNLEAGANGKNGKPKKRSNRANKNQQNEHMKHLLQDYSHMKR